MYFGEQHSLRAPHTVPRRGRVVYVVLIALAWLQVSFASHQFEHAVGDLTDSCTVCSHFDRLEHSVPPDGELPQLPRTHAAFACVSEDSADVCSVICYRSRAPPTA